MINLSWSQFCIHNTTHASRLSSTADAFHRSVASWYSVVIIKSVERFVGSSRVLIVSVMKVVSLVERFVTLSIVCFVTLYDNRRAGGTFHGVVM